MNKYSISVEYRTTVLKYTGTMKRRHLRRTLRAARKGCNFILVCNGITEVFSIENFVRIRVERQR